MYKLVKLERVFIESAGREKCNIIKQTKPQRGPMREYKLPLTNEELRLLQGKIANFLGEA